MLIIIIRCTRFGLRATDVVRPQKTFSVGPVESFLSIARTDRPASDFDLIRDGKTFLVFNKNMYARAQCVCTRGSSSVPKGWWWEKCAEERKEKDQHANVRSDKRRRQSNRLELQVLFPSNNISMEQVYNWRPRTKRKILLL